MIKIFTLEYLPELKKFDDTALQDFMESTTVMNSKSQFFVLKDMPYWTVAIEYNENITESDSKVKRKDNHEEYLKDLSDAEKELYHTVRRWRNEAAKKKGYNPYILFSNEQLAVAVKIKPDSLAKLADVASIGQSKAEKYGQPLIDMIQAFVLKNQTKVQENNQQKV